jgi:hypothetical protein
MLQQAQSPRTATQAVQRREAEGCRAGPTRLTQLARDLNASLRNRALDTLAQRMPVQRVQDDIDAPHLSEAKWKLDRAAQRKPAQLKPLRSALMNSAARTPIQRAWRDYIPSWRTTKAIGTGLVAGGLAATGVGLPAAALIGLASGSATYIGGVGAGVGAAALGAGGVLAAGALGASALPYAATALGGLAGGAMGLTAGQALTPAIGQKGKLATAAAGAVGGALLPAAGLLALGAGFGGTLGADIQSAATSHPVRNSGVVAPGPENALFYRAREVAQRTHANPTALQIANQLPDATRAFVVGRLAPVAGQSEDAKKALMPGYIALHLANSGQAANQGDAANVATAPRVAAVGAELMNLNFIQDILAGNRAAPGPNDALRFAGAGAPAGAEQARQTFNSLVKRPRPLPNVTLHEGSVKDPVSYMSDDGTLTTGWGTTEGVTVHEMGHHLENNLSPSKFATLHNFLIARAGPGANLRRVGYGHLHNQPATGTGYSSTTPNPVAPGKLPLTTLGVSAIGHSAGLTMGEKGIDRFIQSHAHTPESSYATKVYDPATAARTEYVATTIHFLTDPASARALIATDPIRVALYLYLANPRAYKELKRRLAHRIPAVHLDTLIHKIG